VKEGLSSQTVQQYSSQHYKSAEMLSASTVVTDRTDTVCVHQLTALAKCFSS